MNETSTISKDQVINYLIDVKGYDAQDFDKVSTMTLWDYVDNVSDLVAYYA